MAQAGAPEEISRKGTNVNQPEFPFKGSTAIVLVLTDGVIDEGCSIH